MNNGGIEPKNESLPRETSVRQLQQLRKITKGTDIGDRIPKMNGIPNSTYIGNPVDHIESYEDFQRNNKHFVSSWNLKHMLSPYEYRKKKN